MNAPETGSGSSPLPRRLCGLLRPDAYPHPVNRVEVIETQLSWVLIAGERVYKIKRPVVYPFADFSTLEHRRRFCHEELRLNRRFVPQLYLEVCGITGRGDDARIGGEGPLNDYAVVMRLFDRREELDRLVRERRVEASELARFGERLAGLHARLPHDPASRTAGSPASVAAACARNARECAEFSDRFGTAARIDTVARLLAEEAEARGQAIAWRLESGCIRECHGDLHLSNVARIDGELAPFDCLEFEPAFRWIDVAQDVAFLVADLQGYGARQLANAFLNGYLAHSGDYHLCSVLPLYVADRALVRAKVMALLTTGQRQPDAGYAQLLLRRHLRYLEVAERALGARTACCLVMSGLPGSGKSWLAVQLAPLLAAIHVRSDLERKRLAGLAPREHSASEVGGGIYTDVQTDAVYQRLEHCAAEVLSGRQVIVLDANFGQRRQRAAIASLCSLLGVTLVVVHCEAPNSVLRQRIQARMNLGSDVSEADLAVLDTQLTRREAIVADEQLNVIAADTTRADVVAHVLGELRHHCAGLNVELRDDAAG